MLPSRVTLVTKTGGVAFDDDVIAALLTVLTVLRPLRRSSIDRLKTGDLIYN